MENTPTNNVVGSANEIVPPVAQAVALPGSDVAQVVAPVTQTVANMPSLAAGPCGTKLWLPCQVWLLVQL